MEPVTGSLHEIAGRASFDAWRELVTLTEKYERGPKISAAWGVFVVQRGVDIHAQLRRSDWKQATSRYTTPGWKVCGDLEGLQNFDELARRTAILVGYEELNGDEVRDWLLVIVRDYFLKQDRAGKEAVGFSGNHETGNIDDIVKATKIVFRAITRLAPTKGTMRRRNIQDSQAELGTAKTAESEVLSNLPQNDKGREEPGETPASRRNRIVKEFRQNRDWGRRDLGKHRWKLRPLMEELDNKDLSLPRGERYKQYKNYCHVFDDAKLAYSYYVVDGEDEPEFHNSDPVYSALIETLSRGMYPK